MSDLRVDTTAIQTKYGLNRPDQQMWSVIPVWQAGSKGKQLVTLDNAEAAGEVVQKVARVFAARTMAQQREAVQCVEQEVLWDAPDIRLTNRDHLRMATYIFKRLAHPSIIPTVAAVCEPSPGCTLIELDTVYVLRATRLWFAPITWLLPDESVSHVHMKIGVNGSLESGKIEMMVARWTNWPPIPPFAWQRGLAGMLLGAVPYAFEGLLGYLIDYADGDNYYSQQRVARFNKRHPDTTNPLLDWVTDAAGDVQQWAVELGVVALQSAHAVLKSSVATVSGLLSSILNFYIGLLVSLVMMAETALNSLVAGINYQTATVTGNPAVSPALGVSWHPEGQPSAAVQFDAGYPKAGSDGYGRGAQSPAAVQSCAVGVPVHMSKGAAAAASRPSWP